MKSVLPKKEPVEKIIADVEQFASDETKQCLSQKYIKRIYRINIVKKRFAQSQDISIISD